MNADPARRVALLVPRFAWALRSGIARYASPPLLWDTITYERSDEGFHQARTWKPHGVIGMLGRRDLMRRAGKLRAPIVNIHGGRHYPGAFQIGCDHTAIGKMAAEHLSACGFSNFACIGFPGEDPTPIG